MAAGCRGRRGDEHGPIWPARRGRVAARQRRHRCRRRSRGRRQPCRADRRAGGPGARLRRDPPHAHRAGANQRGTACTAGHRPGHHRPADHRDRDDGSAADHPRPRGPVTPRRPGRDHRCGAPPSCWTSWVPPRITARPPPSSSRPRSSPSRTRPTPLALPDLLATLTAAPGPRGDVLVGTRQDSRSRLRGVLRPGRGQVHPSRCALDPSGKRRCACRLSPVSPTRPAAPTTTANASRASGTTPRSSAWPAPRRRHRRRHLRHAPRPHARPPTEHPHAVSGGRSRSTTPYRPRSGSCARTHGRARSAACPGYGRARRAACPGCGE